MSASIREAIPAPWRMRCRILTDRPAPGTGGYVLYWMHHAMRGHDNPALDVARLLAVAYDRPLLVYQGLAGAHPYNSDRHWWFILQGAREVAAELAAAGVRYAFHGPTDPAHPSPMPDLAAEAEGVVVEDYPAPPFPQWTRRLAARAKGPVVAVDAQCLVPVGASRQAPTRAFAFRDRFATERAEALDHPLPSVPVEPAPYAGALPFTPVDWGDFDIAAHCAAARIDHAVGPVAANPGGGRAGYRRWARFQAQGLDGYADARNDAALAWPRGVSRLSPYLHYGQVSPFRIAREAHARGGKGAEKFLDELLVWRELAYHYVHHLGDTVQGLEALPHWAQETLAQHAEDPRPRLLSWEALSRGLSGSPLWDAAQRSLLRHGELHNNLRMTWGKALVSWSPDPATALERLYDLNHRWAVDGSDPNSYAGLLWCLGGLDRPFAPEQPILGRVRGRAIDHHARRLDRAAFEARTAPAPRWTIAVVGGGLSGLMAARCLQDQGHAVTVIDKGRRVGGRCNHRARDGADFDHGAQYFTVRDPRLAPYLASWQDDGVVARWSGRIAVADGGQIAPKDRNPDRYVGTPHMAELPRHLARDLTVYTARTVTALEPAGPDASAMAPPWRLAVDSADPTRAPVPSATYDAVLLALPAPQCTPFAPEALQAELAAITMRPCLTVMVRFPVALPIPADGLFVEHPVLAWAARNASKPGRPPAEAWVLHGTATWSAEHADAPEAFVQSALLTAFFEATGVRPQEPSDGTIHRWRYSRPAAEHDHGALWDAASRIGACGDWCLGGRIEGALLSGMAAAGRIQATAVDSVANP